MDRLLFGDNQFFGVNHMSEERARAQAMRFQNLDAVMNVLDTAYDEGIRTFMCTTHDRIAEVAQRVRKDSDRYADFVFYPCMPYAHKYANAVTDYGMLGVLKKFLPDESLLSATLRGGKAFARKDIESVITMLVDAEMSMFEGLRTPVVFLQNVVVDLLLGLGFDEAFAVFARHVEQRYGAEPGFITMNLPRLLDTLDRVGVANPSCAAASTSSASACAAASRPIAPFSRSVSSGRSRCRSMPRERSRPVRHSSGSPASRGSSRWSSAPPAGRTSVAPGTSPQPRSPAQQPEQRRTARGRRTTSAVEAGLGLGQALGGQ